MPVVPTSRAKAIIGGKQPRPVASAPSSRKSIMKTFDKAANKLETISTWFVGLIFVASLFGFFYLKSVLGPVIRSAPPVETVVDAAKEASTTIGEAVTNATEKIATESIEPVIDSTKSLATNITDVIINSIISSLEHIKEHGIFSFLMNMHPLVWVAIYVSIRLAFAVVAPRQRNATIAASKSMTFSDMKAAAVANAAKKDLANKDDKVSQTTSSAKQTPAINAAVSMAAINAFEGLGKNAEIVKHLQQKAEEEKLKKSTK